MHEINSTNTFGKWHIHDIAVPIAKQGNSKVTTSPFVIFLNLCDWLTTISFLWESMLKRHNLYTSLFQ